MKGFLCEGSEAQRAGCAGEGDHCPAAVEELQGRLARLRDWLSQFWERHADPICAAAILILILLIGYVEGAH